MRAITMSMMTVLLLAASSLADDRLENDFKAVFVKHWQISKEFTLAVTLYADKDFSMIDVIHPSITKGSTLSEWAALRNVAGSEILAIGDNHNDLEMLSFAGIPVVMGNGVPELKAHGWHVTLSNDEDGVAAAIWQFALQEASECA